MNGWSFAPHRICWPARWQRFDTVHSVASESGQLHAGRQTRHLPEGK